jgi:hypothetical protein
MTDKPKNQIEADTQPAYDPPQALRMGDIHAGTGGTGCTLPGSGASPCGAGNSAVGECLGDGTGAGYYCTTTGNSPAIPE